MDSFPSLKVGREHRHRLIRTQTGTASKKRRSWRSEIFLPLDRSRQWVTRFQRARSKLLGDIQLDVAGRGAGGRANVETIDCDLVGDVLRRGERELAVEIPVEIVVLRHQRKPIERSAGVNGERT